MASKRKKKKEDMALVIDIHMIPVSKKKKTKMMHGGMANSKMHSYAAGGAVIDKMKKKKGFSKGGKATGLKWGDMTPMQRILTNMDKQLYNSLPESDRRDIRDRALEDEQRKRESGQIETIRRKRSK